LTLEDFPDLVALSYITQFCRDFARCLGSTIIALDHPTPSVSAVIAVRAMEVFDE
jgi:hypothetical protein